jgi:hypothetical protein
MRVFLDNLKTTAFLPSSPIPWKNSSMGQRLSRLSRCCAIYQAIDISLSMITV